MNGVSEPRRIPEATVARLPLYLRSLLTLADEREATCSSERLADLAGVNAAKVRKDLSYLGSYGTRGVGYDVEFLLHQVSRALGLSHDWPVVIVGAGNLGQALAGYAGFGDRGFPVGGIVDVDPSKVDTVVGGARVKHIDDLPQVVQSKQISIGVIACQVSGVSSCGSKRSMDMIRSPAGPCAGCIPCTVITKLRPRIPVIFAIEGPFRSASRIPTVAPAIAAAVARLTARILLPTPPLPLTMATVARILCSLDRSRMICSLTWPSILEPPSPIRSL